VERVDVVAASGRMMSGMRGQRSQRTAVIVGALSVSSIAVSVWLVRRYDGGDASAIVTVFGLPIGVVACYLA
jgi:hypothetical protein